MNISTLISQLAQLQKQHGNINVLVGYEPITGVKYFEPIPNEAGEYLNISVV